MTATTFDDDPRMSLRLAVKRQPPAEFSPEDGGIVSPYTFDYLMKEWMATPMWTPRTPFETALVWLTGEALHEDPRLLVWLAQVRAGRALTLDQEDAIATLCDEVMKPKEETAMTVETRAPVTPEERDAAANQLEIGDLVAHLAQRSLPQADRVRIVRMLKRLSKGLDVTPRQARRLRILMNRYA